jgi:phosphatidylglycerol:prolipoprotein diacylglycerol transferase
MRTEPAAARCCKSQVPTQFNQYMAESPVRVETDPELTPKKRQNQATNPPNGKKVRSNGARSTSAHTPAPNDGVPQAFRRPTVRPHAQASMGVTTPRRAAKSPTSRVKRDPTAAFFALPVDEKQLPARGRAASFLSEAGPHAVAATYSFQLPPADEPYDIAVRFIGIRRGVSGPLGTQDQFERVERIKGLLSDGNEVSLTARVPNLKDGEWRVVAAPLDAPGPPDVRALTRRVIETRTQSAPLAYGPQVRVWSWPALVGLGALVAAVLQAMLAHRAGLSSPALFGLSAVGGILGFLGGKAWYLALHRRPLREFLHAGACIQGFLLVALGVLAVGSVLLGLPVGAVLDLTTPGIFFGVAIGRPGCFFTGCCAGRPTRHSWGLVSSDRRLTVRRFPVQLYEATAGLLLGVVSLSVLSLSTPAVEGAVFVVSVAAYTLVRQLLFPLRTDPRTRGGRLLTITASSLVVAGGLAVL